MNKIYKLIWSQTANAFVVVSELATARGKSSSTTNNAALGAWVAVSEITKSKGKKSNKAIKSGVLVSSLVLFAGNAIAAPYDAGGGSATGLDSVAIGSGAASQGLRSVAMGADSEAIGIHSTAIGPGAKAAADDALALGRYAQAIGKYSTAVGDQAKANQEFSTALGYRATANAVRSTAIGMNSSTSGDDSVSIGNSSSVSGKWSAALGQEASVQGDWATAIGYKANAQRTGSTAIGTWAKTSGVDAAAFGNAAEASGSKSLALGRSAKAYSSSGIAMGTNAKAGIESQAKADNAIAIGTGAQATGKQSISVGKGNVVSRDKSGAFGDSTTISGTGSYSVGNNNTIATNDTFVVGSNVTKTLDNSVFLGKNAAYTAKGASTDGIGAVTEPVTVGGKLTYGGFAGKTPVGVVSVGDVGKERRIQNVAAGKIAATSTDAINGSQLYATNAKLGNVANTVVKNFGGNATLNADGNITYTNIGNTGKDNIHDAIKAATTKVEGDKGVSVTPKTNADGSKTYTVAAKTDNTTVKVDNNGNIAAVTAPLTTNTDGKVNTPAAPNALATAGDIANAINNSGWKLAADGTSGTELINPSDTVTFKTGSSNLTVKRNGANITYDLARNINVDSVQIGANGPKITNDGNNIKVGDKNGNATKITNVAAGTGNTDAVNVSQLKAAQAAATTKVAGDKGVSVTPKTNADGSTTYTVAAKTDNKTVKVDGNGNIAAVTAPLTTNTDGKVNTPAAPNALATAGDIANAINNSGWKLAADGTTGTELINPSDTVTFKTGSSNLTVKRDGANITYDLAKDIAVDSVKTGDTTVNTYGVSIANADPNKVVSLTASGLNNGNNRITNVAAGTADTDAVNVSQLKAATTTKVEGDKGVSVTPKTNADGSKTYTVAAKTDNTTVKVDNNGNIAAVTAPLTTNTDGKVNTPAAPNALATAGDIANAINNSGWKLAADGTSGTELINPSDTVTFKTGSSNLTVKRNGANITYDLARNINVDSVQIGANGPKITNDGNNIKIGDKNGNATKITNVAAGTGDTDAVNVSQLKAATTHYYSVNDGGTQGSNYNNDGATGGNSLAAGVGTQASGISSTAIGHNAKASSANAIAMGVNASASQRNALAMGSSASSATEDSVAIGKDVKVLDTGAPQTDQEGSVAIGSRTEVSGKASVGIGRNVRATARNAVAIGDAALATNTQAVAIARDAQASGAGAVAMGSASRSTSSHTTALGVRANASVSRSVALGSDAVADRIGFNIARSPVTTDANATFAANQVYANAGATQAAKNAVIATVRNTTTDTYGAVSVGNAGVTRQIINLAPGSEDSDAVNVAQLKAATTHYYSVNDNGVQRANYNNDGATGINSLAAGTAASATESAATAVGNQATAAARNSVALGNQATANTAWSVAIGNKADATGSSAVAIGNGATTTVGDSVALGAGSKADANGRAVTEATVNGLTFGDFAGSVTHPGKVVSVGAKGEERQIKNVAPGQISNTSTDAINGSQLYATNAKLGNVAKTVVENFGGNATLNPDGSITYTNIGNTGKDNIHDAIQAATTKVEGDKGVTVSPSTNADGSTTYTVAAKTDGVTTQVDSNGNIAAVTTTFTPSTDGKVGAPVGNGDSLVTAKTVADAINSSGFTLKTSATANGKKLAGGDELINPGDSVEMIAGKNMQVTQEINGKVTYATKDEVEFNKVTVGPVSINNVTGINAGNTAITNVKAGVADTDAVNVSQLKAAQAAATTKVEGDKGVSVTPTTNADGSKTYTVAAKTDNTTVKVDGNGNIAAVTTTFTPSTDGKVGAPVGNGDSLVTANTVANAINNSGWKLVADGTDGTELINPSDTVTFKTGSDNLTVTRTGADITYDLARNINVDSVQIGANGPKITKDDNGNIQVGDKDGNAVKITNVAAGTAPTDAVNVSQLEDRVGGIENRVNNRIDDVADDANAGVSSAMAMAALPQAYIPGKSMLTGGIASYNGEGAVAVGFSKLSDNGRWVLKVSGSADTEGNAGGAVGAGFHF